MPWKTNEVKEQRRRFVEARLRRGGKKMVALCREFGISRECGYKWWRRFCAEGRRGLADRSRRPAAAEQLVRRWLERVLRVRREHRDWGALKLRWALRQRYRRGPWPGAATIARWLAAAGLVRPRRRRAR